MKHVTVLNTTVVGQFILLLALSRLPFSDFVKFPIVGAILIGWIFTYGNYRCNHPEFKDPLEKSIFDEYLPWLDGWAFLHLWAFFLIGLFIRNNQNTLTLLLLSFGVGIIWEVFEHVVGKERPGWMGGYGGCNMATDKIDGNWWYGKWTDLLMNGTGLLLGHGLKTAIG